MIGGNFQKNFLERDIHSYGIKNAVGARSMAAMMVVGGGILIAVVGGKLLSVGIGFAMGGALVLLIV